MNGLARVRGNGFDLSGCTDTNLRAARKQVDGVFISNNCCHHDHITLKEHFCSPHSQLQGYVKTAYQESLQMSSWLLFLAFPCPTMRGIKYSAAWGFFTLLYLFIFLYNFCKVSIPKKVFHQSSCMNPFALYIVFFKDSSLDT